MNSRKHNSLAFAGSFSSPSAGSFARSIKIIALFVALALFVLINFESFNADHKDHCHDENCVICLVLQIIQNAKNFLFDSKDTPSNCSYFFYIKTIIFSTFILVPATLVSQKIKLVI